MYDNKYEREENERKNTRKFFIYLLVFGAIVIVLLMLSDMVSASEPEVYTREIEFNFATSSGEWINLGNSWDNSTGTPSGSIRTRCTSLGAGCTQSGTLELTKSWQDLFNLPWNTRVVSFAFSDGNSSSTLDYAHVPAVISFMGRGRQTMYLYADGHLLGFPLPQMYMRGVKQWTTKELNEMYIPTDYRFPDTPITIHFRNTVNVPSGTIGNSTAWVDSFKFKIEYIYDNDLLASQYNPSQILAQGLGLMFTTMAGLILYFRS